MASHKTKTNMATLMETEKNRLIRKFHTLLAKGGISNEEKQAMLASYGVTSSREMNTYELLELCDRLSRSLSPREQSRDKWLRRLMAIVGVYLKETDHQPTAEMIGAVIRRAAKAESLRTIPEDRLRSLYNAFNHRVKDLQRVDEITAHLLTK